MENRPIADCWVLGDSGYMLEPWCLTPLPDPQTVPEQRYNSAHSRTRSIVERTIGLLKSRFRCLLGKEKTLLFTPERCVTIIIACAVLHNLAVEFNIPYNEENENEDEPVNVPAEVANPEPVQQLLQAEQLKGREIINRLVAERFT